MGRDRDGIESNGSTLRGQRGLGCTHTPVATSLRRGEEGGTTECTGGNGQSSEASRSRWEDTSFISSTEQAALARDAETGSASSVCGDVGSREVYLGGGQRDKVEERFDLVPPDAMLAVAKAMSEGAAKYGDENWRGLPIDNIVNHAVRHVFLWMSGDRSEDHLGHAAAGMLMAKDMEVRNEW